MITKIIKRDGRKVAFNVEKIATAIFKAAKEVGGNDYDMAEELARQVCEYLEQKIGKKVPTVEEVQDAVEYILIENSHATTAKSFILYRAERTKQRDMNSEVMKMYEELTFKDKEGSAYVADTAMSTMLKYGSEGAKKFNKIMVLDKIKSKAHEDGDIYINAIDFLLLTTNSCQIDLVNLFKNGFSTGIGSLREPNDISSYVALASIAIQANQNDQNGGQSIPNFDYAMALGVKKTYKNIYYSNLKKALKLLTDIENVDDYVEILKKRVMYQYEVEPSLENNKQYLYAEKEELLQKLNKSIVKKVQSFVIEISEKETNKAVFQAMESIIHNLNTMHSRAGAQVPFSSINYGTDTSAEGRLVIKNILLATEAGLGKGETPMFPIQIFKVKEEINYNKEDRNYDMLELACEVSSKRYFPNFSFLDAPFNLKYYKEGEYKTEVAYMGGKIRVMENIHDKTKEITTSRGNLSHTTINLPRLAIKANKDIHKFYILLDEMLDLVMEQLLERYKIQAVKKVANYPFLMGQGVWLDSDKLKNQDAVKEAIKHGTLSVGFIGLAEALKVLTNKHHGEDKDARKLGLEIVQHMRKRVDDEAKRTKFNYNLFAPPSVYVASRLVSLDKKKFGAIPGITDKSSYTNSFEIPEDFKIDVYEKIKIEAKYHELTNGGHITNVVLNEENNSSEYMKVIRSMKEEGIGYASINHPFYRDPVCSYVQGKKFSICPNCKRKDGEEDIFFEERY